jgi:tRNA pseudouridine32 synthase/23S rRNA pseudouridine746 synthase
MSPFDVAGPPQPWHGRVMWAERVLFIDGEALVIDKPAGLAVHAGPKTRASLEDHLRDLRFGFQRPPTPVHRLDRDTSGCLLLARNPKAHKGFQRAFEEGRVAKTYVAIVDGVPDEAEGRIDLALGKVSSREAGWRIVPDPAGKPAVSHWRMLAVHGDRAAILFSPETGRTHQLRVHAASGLGLPIVGDPVYGRNEGKDVRGPMLLHALTLRLAREGKKDVEATAPLPPSFAYAGFALRFAVSTGSTALRMSESD